MKELKGFDAEYRRYFSQLSEKGTAPFTIAEAAQLLSVQHNRAKEILIRLAKSGWLYRVKQGLYVVVPVTLDSLTPVVEDPWVLANSLFDPCYIGGWDALSYWDFTEQIFIHTFVYTSKPQKSSTQQYLEHTFIVRKTSSEHLFGLKTIWRKNVKVRVSDPSRTIIDLLDAPQYFGGGSVLEEVFREYLRSNHRDVSTLVEYALRLKNKAVVKRLGFLLDTFDILESGQKNLLLKHISTGNAKLIPSQECPRLITKWHLWVPESWKNKKIDH
jgi:predicted transcriptional regulator of viral defense system